MALELKSRAFSEGDNIPKKYTCDGENVSPPLSWSGAPDTTRSFLLVCSDPDAPGGTFMHWAAYDIPANMHEIAEGHGPETLAGDTFQQAMNDFGKPGYGGPCPPEGHVQHHYHFRLTALSEETLPVAPSASCTEVMEVARPYVLAETALVGVYERK